VAKARKHCLGPKQFDKNRNRLEVPEARQILASDAAAAGFSVGMGISPQNTPKYRRHLCYPVEARPVNIETLKADRPARRHFFPQRSLQRLCLIFELALL
jgi:hypothetical protein